MKSSTCIARMPINLLIASCLQNSESSLALTICFIWFKTWLTLLYHELVHHLIHKCISLASTSVITGIYWMVSEKNTSFSSLSPCRNAEVKSSVLTCQLITEFLNITFYFFIFWVNHIFFLISDVSKTMCFWWFWFSLSLSLGVVFSVHQLGLS